MPFTTLVIECSGNNVYATQKGTGELIWTASIACEDTVRIIGIRLDGFLALEGSKLGCIYTLDTRNGATLHPSAFITRLGERMTRVS